MRITRRVIADILQEFFRFGLGQARSCVFAGSFFLLLFLSNELPLGGLARYDFLLFAALGLQALLLALKVESDDEVKTILLFHVIGFALESFKTHPAIGSWAYPEDAFFKIGGVPLYSGFMYSAVASYVAQSWRRFSLRLEGYPPHAWSIPLCIAIYLNFFTHHFLPDFRWLLSGLVILAFRKTDVSFVAWRERRHMPLLASFVLIGFFIWVAENISTLLGAWQYPNQVHVWDLVSFGKISSWSLLVIISFILIAELKRAKAGRLDKRLARENNSSGI